MLYWPARSPCSISNRLLGGSRNSSTCVAESSNSSFAFARRSRCGGNPPGYRPRRALPGERHRAAVLVAPLLLHDVLRPIRADQDVQLLRFLDQPRVVEGDGNVAHLAVVVVIPAQ